MGRDDSQMSVPPLIMAAIPVPDPPPVTWTRVPGLLRMYVSAHRCPRIRVRYCSLTVTGFGRPEPLPQFLDASRLSALRKVRILIFMSIPQGNLRGLPYLCEGTARFRLRFR